MKRCATSLVSREMWIKTSISCHHIPIKRANIKKKKSKAKQQTCNNSDSKGHRDTGSLGCCWKDQEGPVHWRAAGWVSGQQNARLQLGTDPSERMTCVLTITCTTVSIEAFILAREQKWSRCSSRGERQGIRLSNEKGIHPYYEGASRELCCMGDKPLREGCILYDSSYGVFVKWQDFRNGGQTSE